MVEKKRKIIPHKGGRTERMAFRVKTVVKERILQIAANQNVSPADILEKWALEAKI